MLRIFVRIKKIKVNMTKNLIIYSDGGARNNPGPAGIGAVLYERESLDRVAEISEYIGQATNNQAEYTALLRALEKAKALDGEEITCYLDSELVVKQLNREYKVKDPELAKLFVKIWNLSQQFKKITFNHVRREKNTEADKLVNMAIDRIIKKSD